MVEHFVICGDAPAPPAGKQLHVRLEDPGRTFKLELEDISVPMGGEIPRRLVDLLEIASYVFAADQSISRGGRTRREWGSDWRRSIQFRVPVRDLEFWRDESTSSALVRALSFLSEDEYRFEFVPAGSPAPFQAYLALRFGPRAAFDATDVMLFSGGADSLACAVDALAGTDRRVALVSHRSSQKMLSHQRDLAAALQRRFPGRVRSIRVYGARIGGGDAPETTQRTRTFLYTALAFVVARMFGVEGIRLCENGVVSINLPFSEQIVGTMATRTTHPYAVRLLREFLSLIADGPVHIKNPFVWNTKTEVFESLKRSGAVDLVRYSVSCSNVRDMTRLHPHCGRCFQCLDRRFAALAAGLDEDDPAEMYATDLFFGARESDTDRVMALDFCRHGVALAQMSEHQFFASFGGEVGRVLEGFPETSADTVGEKSLRLFQAHGRAVETVLSRAVESASLEIVRRNLPATSLLRLYLEGSGRSLEPPPALSAEQQLQVSRDEPATPPDTWSIHPMQIALDLEAREARVRGLAVLRGRKFDVVAVLAELYQADLAAGTSLEKYRYASADDLADRLSTDADNIRRIVKRAKDDVSGSLMALGEDATGNELIATSKSRKGYRLNPSIRMVAADQA